MALQNYEARFTFLTSDSFIKRVQMAAIIQAVIIGKEASTVPNHAARLTLAQKVASSTNAYAATFAYVVMTDLTLDDTITDAALQAGVASNWNLVAGV